MEGRAESPVGDTGDSQDDVSAASNTSSHSTGPEAADQPHADVFAYADAAQSYLQLGYQPLPLFSGKGVTPAGFTGYDGKLVTPEDVERWSTSHDAAKGGLCLRLVDMLGLDLDAHAEGKNAAEHWARLQKELGPLPPTWLTSSRVGSEDYDGLSGIRLYRLPDKYKALQRERRWKGILAPGIDVVRFAHRQANAWPTVHKRGTRYQWLNEATGELVDGVIPASSEDLPELPESWCEYLLKPVRERKPPREKQPSPEQGPPRGRKPPRTESTAQESEWWTEGKPCTAVAAALSDILKNLAASRHDEALRGVLRLTRLGEQGHQGVRDAVETLKREFLRRVTEDGSRSLGVANAEWSRAVEGLAAEIERQGFTPPESRGCCGLRGRASFAADAGRDEAFFTSTPVLAHIRHAAHSRMLEPWGVLGAVLARVVAEPGHPCRDRVRLFGRCGALFA